MLQMTEEAARNLLTIVSLGLHKKGRGLVVVIADEDSTLMRYFSEAEWRAKPALPVQGYVEDPKIDEWLKTYDSSSSLILVLFQRNGDQMSVDTILMGLPSVPPALAA